jgi:aldehyde dehydrogenase (NAD+)
LNAGQTCIGPDYTLLHERIADRFVSAAKLAVERFYGPMPSDWKKSRDFARVIDDQAFARLSKLLSRSVEMGAKVAFGGAVDASERYIAPTLLTDVTRDMPIMGEEIFGPILPTLVVKNIDEATAFVRQRDKPLALYLFTDSRETMDSVTACTTAGGTVVNHVLLHMASPYLPFGGVGASGQGNYHGEHGFRTFSHARAVLEQKTASATEVFFPPYDAKMNAMAQALLKRLE